MTRFPGRFLCLLLLLALGHAAVLAATYIVPDDAALVSQADLILRGRVLDAESKDDARAGIVTDIRIHVETVLKGSVDGGILTIRQIGGVIGDQMRLYPGTGSFRANERVLLMLRDHPDSPPRLLNYALGKFHVGLATNGREMAFRDGLLAARAHSPGPAPYRERPRELAAFELYIERLASGREVSADYFHDDWTLAPELAPSWELLELPGGDVARWPEFDQDQAVVFHVPTSPPNGSMCGDFQAATERGVEDWNGDGSAQGWKILLDYGGPDAGVAGKCIDDLDNEIGYDDPCGDVSPDLTGCSGTLALGGFYAASSPRTTACPAKGNPSFWRIVSGQIMVNNGVGNCLGCCDWEDMIAHETGHMIGFGHSAVSSALMYGYLHTGRCGVLQPDDRSAAECVYTAPGTCVPPLLSRIKVDEDSPTKVKVKIFGSGFKAGDIVQIDSGSGYRNAPLTKLKSSTKIIGKQVASIFPNGATVQVRVMRAAGCASDPLPASR